MIINNKNVFQKSLIIFLLTTRTIFKIEQVLFASLTFAFNNPKNFHFIQPRTLFLNGLFLFLTFLFLNIAVTPELDGTEADIVIKANSTSDYREKLNQELEEIDSQELWQTAKVLRNLRP